jgi:hypothetical protein
VLVVEIFLASYSNIYKRLTHPRAPACTHVHPHAPVARGCRVKWTCILQPTVRAPASCIFIQGWARVLPIATSANTSLRALSRNHVFTVVKQSYNIGRTNGEKKEQTFRWVALHRVTSHRVASHNVTSHNVTLHNVTLHNVTLHRVEGTARAGTSSRLSGTGRPALGWRAKVQRVCMVGHTQNRIRIRIRDRTRIGSRSRTPLTSA